MLENTVSLSFTDKRITTQLWQRLYYVNCKKVFGLTKLIYTQIYMTNKVNMHLPEYSLQPPAPSPKEKNQTNKKPLTLNLERYLYKYKA